MRYVNLTMLGLAVLVAACATVQQAAIKADMAYSTAVFALDDAEWAGCHPLPVAPLTADLCAPLDVKVGQALLDVQAVTKAIQAFPVTVPTSLAALLTDLNSIQLTLIGLEQTPLIMSIAAKTADANAKAIALLTKVKGQ
jgi:hypothetical protein